MLFTTDTQTLDDLNVFGKHGAGSIFSMFNRCTTRGGAAVLDEMLRYPMADMDRINRRAAIIQYFLSQDLAFPFPGILFDAIEPYLANQDERTRLSTQGVSLAQKLGNMVAPDAATTQLLKGIQALVELLRGCNHFFQNLSLPAGHGYEQERNAALNLLSASELKPLLSNSQKPVFDQLAAYDSLLRFRNRQDLQKLMQLLYRLDVYIAVAKVAKERGFAFATARPDTTVGIRLQHVYHAQVPNAVANSIHINAGGNVVFLTGANMAGKSTFMKALSTAIYLAHTGFPVAAKAMEFSVLDGIFTTINLPDNLGMGASHFYAEVMRVKKVANELALGKKLFIVFDELFRGTNVKDACEGTIAITKGFAHRNNSVFVISTHIIEAGPTLQEACPNIRFLYLPTRMNGHQPVYTYTLENGITDDRHGMVIIRNEGILNMLETGLLKTQTL